MKRITLLAGLIVVFMLSNCAGPKEEKVDIDNEITEVKKVLDKYRYANENQDMNLIEEIWCDDETIVSIGTESGERLVGFSEIRKAIQFQFDNFTEVFITPANQLVQISEDGRTAWFSQTMNYNFILDGKPYEFPHLRYTGVLMKKNGKWKIVQTHMSVPYNPLRER
ncbi:MAG TPA: nuclear transport factor 2 family protein [Bacteroidales bacterium]|mgnify:FL=1|nr:nuclear transport factor 2 family protein [Bacteroidales bacterium]HPR59144.1 nuclear transport factor 2 family protein [Bacteroidales bacterium]